MTMQMAKLKTALAQCVDHLLRWCRELRRRVSVVWR